MKKISLWLFILAFTTVAARAQDAETTERLNKVEGYVQDLQAAQLAQDKHIEALEKEIADLRDKLNQPGANNYAGADDLQKLAGQVQDLAKKQQADNDLILKETRKTRQNQQRSNFESQAAAGSCADTFNGQPDPPAGRRRAITTQFRTRTRYRRLPRRIARRTSK